LVGDGSLDQTFTVTLQAGNGNRTITSIDLRRSDNSGIWDTILGNNYWVTGAATSLDTPLLNASNGAVNFVLTDGGSFNIFAANYGTLFAPGSSFTVTLGFSDGTTAATTTIIPTPPSIISLSYNGKLRDRVGQGEYALAGDGSMDGTFTVTLLPGNGSRTVTNIDLRRSADSGIWDTIPGNGYWVAGAANSLDATLLNSANGTVNFSLGDGASFVVFASEFGNLFASGSNFTITLSFSDGTATSASVTVP